MSSIISLFYFKIPFCSDRAQRSHHIHSCTYSIQHKKSNSNPQGSEFFPDFHAICLCFWMFSACFSFPSATRLGIIREMLQNSSDGGDESKPMLKTTGAEIVKVKMNTSLFPHKHEDQQTNNTKTTIDAEWKMFEFTLIKVSPWNFRNCHEMFTNIGWQPSGEI